MTPVTIVHPDGRDDGLFFKGHEAVALAERAARDGRTDEAKQLIEIAYKMFDAATSARDRSRT